MNQTTKAQQRTAFMGTDAIFPLLLKMGIPAAVAMIVNALYNIVDTMFVGHGVGPLAIAALSIVFPIQMIVSAIAQAIGVGTASIVSRRLGEKREADAACAIGTAYTSIFLSTATLVALVMIFLRPILRFFGASEGIMPYGMEYLSTVAPGFFFFASTMAASNLVRAEGNAKASMIGMIIGALMNCLLDPLFIFGFKMGVRGAALATVISQGLSCIYLFSLYFNRRTHVRLELSHFKIRMNLLLESTILGAPAFIQTAGMSILALIINTSLGTYGGDQAIAIYGMNHRLISLVIFPILGMVQGFQPVVGYNFGARRFDRVKKTLRVTILTVTAIAAVIYTFIMAFPQLCIALFSSDPVLIQSAARVLRIMVLFIPLAALQIIGSTYFQAVGKKIQSLFLGLSRQFLLLIPLVLILPRFFNTDGVWASFPTADLLSTLITGSLVLRELAHLDERHKEQKGLPENYDEARSQEFPSIES